MVTKEQAIAAGMWGQMFYHVRLRNKDGTAVRCRSIGRCKTWKTRPDDWRLPVKHGRRDSFLTPANAADWDITDYVQEERDRADLCAKLGLSNDVPDSVLHDAQVDAGLVS